MKNDKYDYMNLCFCAFAFVMQLVIYLHTRAFFPGLMAIFGAFGVGFIGGGMFIKSIWGPIYESVVRLVKWG